MTTPMEPITVERCRPVSVGDAMVFVAAAAVGLWLSKGFITSVRVTLSSLRSATRVPWSLVGTLAVYLLNVGVSFLLVLTAAFLAVRLRGPRPPLARVALQPGMVACEAQTLAFVLAAFLAAVEMVPGDVRWVFVGVLLPAVPLAWGLLAWNGRWRREPGWIDRLGVWLGAGWCLEILLYCGLITAFPD